MFHKDANTGEIHVPYNWQYADAATREAATGFVASDVGKFAIQDDDKSLWQLTAHSPAAWKRVNVGGDGLFYLNKSDGESSTTAETWQDKCTLSIPVTLPPSDYVCHYSAEIYILSGGYTEVRFLADGNEKGYRKCDEGYYVTFAGIIPVSLGVEQSPFDFKIQWRRETSGTAYIRRARMLFQRLS